MVAIGALLLTLKLSNKTMKTSFIPFSAIIAVLIIAFLFASLPQVSHKMRYRVLYAIAIIMLFAVIPISECMAKNTKNSNSNYLLVLIFDIAVGYFCMYIAALLKYNVLKRKNQALENALTEKQQKNVAILLEHQNEKQQALQQRELEWLAGKIKMFTEEEQEAILAEIDQRLTQIDKAIEIERENIKNLQELKARIISDAVTGKLDVRAVEIPEYEYVADQTEDDSDENEVAIEEQED